MSVDLGRRAVRRPAATTSTARSARSPRRRGWTSRSSCGPSLPPAIRTDDMRLRQVLRNLLSNALKFTEKGSVKLRIFVAERARVERGQRGAEPGRHGDRRSRSSTPASASPRTSRRSSSRRSSRPTAAPAASTAAPGSGLAISREIATLLGGELHLVSEPGEGSTFTLYLPRRVRAPAAQPPAAGADAPRRAPAGAAEPGRPAAGRRQRRAQRGDPAGRAAPRAEHAAARTVLRRPAPAGGRRPRAADRRGRRDLRPHPAGPGRATAASAAWWPPPARRRSSWPARLNPDAHHPGPAPARHGRLGGARSAEARPAHPPHPGARHLGPGRRAPRPGAGGASRSCRRPPTWRPWARRIGRLQTFLERKVKRLLVVEDDDVQRKAIVELIGNGDVMTTAVDSAEEALADAASSEPFDCVVLDLQAARACRASS